MWKLSKNPWNLGSKVRIMSHRMLHLQHHHHRPCSVGALVMGSVEKAAVIATTITTSSTTKSNDASRFMGVLVKERHCSLQMVGAATKRLDKNSKPQEGRLPLPRPCTLQRRLAHESCALRSFSSSAIHRHDHDEAPTPTDVANASSSRRIPFLLADIGEGIAEVELMQWFVQEGDHVQQFDRICEVQSDKATVEITSRYDGQITSLEHDKGDMVKVGTPLLYLMEPSPSSSEEQVQGVRSQNSGTSNTLPTMSTMTDALEEDKKLHIPSSTSQVHRLPGDQDHAPLDSNQNTWSDGGGAPPLRGGEVIMMKDDDTTTSRSTVKVSTSPAIRKLAMDYSLDLSTIAGTGPNGRVLKGDVLAVLQERGLATSSLNRREEELPTIWTGGAVGSGGSLLHGTPIGSNQSAASSVAAASQKDHSPSSDSSLGQTSTSSSSPRVVRSLTQILLPLNRDTILEMRGYNRVMVQTMAASLRIPHMVYSDEVDVTSLRTRYKADLPFLPFCIKALSMSLLRYPLLNASFLDSNNDDSSNPQVMLWEDHNIGIAMDSPRGLVVPVIRQVQDKSLREIASYLKYLKVCATEGTVDSEDLQGATFTFSNIGALGGVGGTYMSPIVTSPQVAIGALGKIQRVPRFVSEDSLTVKEAYMVNISWAGDHRVIDGATMARFHQHWKSYLQDPIGMIRLIA